MVVQSNNHATRPPLQAALDSLRVSFPSSPAKVAAQQVEHRGRKLRGHALELVKKLRQALPVFEALEKHPHGDSCPTKDRLAAEFLGID